MVRTIGCAYEIKLFFISEVDNVNQRAGKGVNHVQRQRNKIPIEKSVIPTTDAITQPWTVMVEVLHAVVTHRTMRTP